MTKFCGNTYTIDKFQCNHGIPRFNISKVVRIMTFLRVHIMCPGFSTDAQFIIFLFRSATIEANNNTQNSGVPVKNLQIVDHNAL
jgi:hypothetical protein